MCNLLFISIGTTPYDDFPIRVKFYKMLCKEFFQQILIIMISISFLIYIGSQTLIVIP
jgi:hypothetical protein